MMMQRCSDGGGVEALCRKLIGADSSGFSVCHFLIRPPLVNGRAFRIPPWIREEDQAAHLGACRRSSSLAFVLSSL